MIGIGPAGPLPSGAAVVPGATTGDGTDGAVVTAAERDAWAVLASIDRLGPIAFAALLREHRSARAVLAVAAGPDAIRRLTATRPLERDDVRERTPVSPGLAAAVVEAVQRGPAILERIRALGIRVVVPGEPAYPRPLGEIEMPPHVLFVQGDPAVLAPTRAVAVVGTRRPTTAGRTTAARIAAALVAAEATVVSGLAYGIDGVAHETTLRAGGRTIAVIGGGHAVAVPRGHARLARAIVDSGGAVVSESAPDKDATRGTFPRRNRIVSGLAQATVVVEAPARSGALVTASWALEQGRACFIVPGPIDAPASAGCLAFLREFAGEARIVAGVPQLIADLGYAARPARDTLAADDVARAALQGLGATGSRVASEVLRGRVTVDELTAATDLPVAAVLATLAVLEGRGLVVGVHGRYRPAGVLLTAGEARRTS